MCGIIGVFGNAKPRKVQKLYRAQSHRGSEGFGYVALQGGIMKRHERAEREKSIMERLQKEQGMDAILFHHRFPTSTANVKDAAHPIPVDMPHWKYRYYVLHNGVISGASAARKEIEADGYAFSTLIREKRTIITASHEYTSESTSVNDSEVMGYYLARLLEEGKAYPSTIGGSIAVFIARVDKSTKKTQVYCYRNTSNPLIYRADGNTLVMGSEVRGKMLEPYTLWQIDLCTLSLIKTGIEVEKEPVYTKFASPYMGFIGSQTPDVPQRTLWDTSDKKVYKGELSRLKRDFEDARAMYEEAAQGSEDYTFVQSLEDYMEEKQEEYEEALLELGVAV